MARPAFRRGLRRLFAPARARAEPPTTGRLLDRVRDWSARLDRPSVEATFTEGPADRDKRGVWAQVEGPAAHGRLTLWDGGQFVVEAYDPTTSEALLLTSGVVTTEDELDALLAKLLATCESGGPLLPPSEISGVVAQRYAEEHLEEVGIDDATWTVEFRDPRDGSTWLMEHPHSELQGGGPPRLRRVSEDDRP